MSDQSEPSFREIRRAAAERLVSSKIYSPSTAVQLVMTGRVTQQQWGDIGLVHGRDPLVSKALSVRVF